MPNLDRCALVIVDVQKGFDDLSYRSQTGRRNKPACERNDGNALKPELTGQPHLVTKQTDSAFYGERDLHARLGARGMTSFAVRGIPPNHCVETTARMGGNVGYEVQFVADACHTFYRLDPSGYLMTADQLT